MRRILAILLVISLLSACVVTANAAVISGKCGDNLTWTLDDDTLTISGTGPMYNYSEENPAPWTNRLGVHYCVIENGVTSIGDYAFAGMGYGSLSVHIPATVTYIGQKALAEKNGMVFFLGSAPIIAANAFEGRTGAACYITGWEEADLQSYGGKQDWIKGDLALTDNNKLLYQHNEQIKPEDFQFKATFNGGYAITYTPQTIKTESYDNSTYGEKKVEVWADGIEFAHRYIVTDGQTHLDLVTVEAPDPQIYTGNAICAGPWVSAGTISLYDGKHYTLSFTNNTEVGTNAQVTVTGCGDWAGFSKTVSFSILKVDIASTSVSLGRASFQGGPVLPEISVFTRGRYLIPGQDYIVTYENNINMGTATYCVVGIGNYYGCVTGEFQIGNENNDVKLSGVYNGQADGELDDQVYHYQEVLLSPGLFTGTIDSVIGAYVKSHYAAYELYRVEEEGMTLVTTKQTDYGNGKKTAFTYDFSAIYEEAAEEGGAVYMLAYSWVNSELSVFSGVCVLYIPAKVPNATSIIVEQLPDIDDFRRVYFSAYGPDGDLGNVEWMTSNPEIATVEDGVVTLKSPGLVTITGKSGALTVSKEINCMSKDIAKCEILSCDTHTKKVKVCYENILLTEDVDYTYSVVIKEKTVEVTVTGIGLFYGRIVQEFDRIPHRLTVHIHSFDNSCDTTCGSCSYIRQVIHQYSNQWSKDQTHHWHACTGCGEKADRAAHAFSPENPDICTVCGPMYTAGDLNGDSAVNEDDAIYLLQHVLLPDFFPVGQDVDYNGDRKINEDDAIYLLQHVLLPDFFPL